MSARDVFAVACLAVTLGCRGAGEDPAKRIIAEVGGKPVSAAQLDAFLAENLLQDPAAEPLPPGDLARVKSRLFDDYLDGELLYQEAQRRGIAVSDAELADYLTPETPESPATPEGRALALRDLTIQKLRESVVRAQLRVDDERVGRWLALHPLAEGEGQSGTLRTLRFASYPEAARVRSEIVGKKLSLEQAEEAYGADSLSDIDHAVDLGAFPDHIATAVKALAPGQVSQPLPFESSVLLFLLDPPQDPAEAEERRREQARQAISLDESEKIADALLEDLRKTTPVVRHADRLPFPYVAEGSAARAQ
ncbi:MAG TPA: SurA N-terminal domain-containing protein [Candidatus Polarisedimenticolaceae bacterium]|nr:SurA N-terminal domain-containing protein [Candidatus Polarisedimenticolaceae bacterium]